MHYGIKTFFFLFTLLLLTGCNKLLFTTGKHKPQTIAFYNVEQLYDAQPIPQHLYQKATSPGRMQWTEERYRKKLQNIATVIAQIGGEKAPALIGLAEVENKQVVQDLVNTPPLRRQQYSFIHYPAAHANGLSLALLYKPKYFVPETHFPIPMRGTAKNAPSGSLLRVKGKLMGEDITLYVTQWPPHNTAPLRRRKSKPNDTAQRSAANTLRQQIEAEQKVNKDANIIVLGDFQTVPSADVIRQVLKATGRPNPYFNRELFNTFYLSHVNGQGSVCHQGTIQMQDQILISKSLLNHKGSLQYVRGSAAIHDPPQAKFLFGKYKDTPLPTFSGTTYFGGYSNHFPVYIKLIKKR